MKTQYKAFSSDVSVVDGERAVSAVISTTAVDRDGEVVIAQGVNAKDFQENPVVFYNHVYADWNATPEDKLPVGKCEAIKRNPDSVEFKMVFAERPAAHPADECWLPDTLLSLYQQGVMKAFSIGFIPTEVRPATDKDLMTYGAECRRVISKSKLLEVSCVPLPANQDAIATAVSKGLITNDQAVEIFGKDVENDPAKMPIEPKSDDDTPPMSTCSVCGKEYPDDDMEDDADGNPICMDCMAAKKTAENPPAPDPETPGESPQKHIVREIESADADPVEVKRVHYIMSSATDESKTVKYVTRQIKKMRGAVYAD